MPAPSTVEEFLDLTRRSNLIEGPQLDGHIEKLRTEGGLPDGPRELAAQLMRDGLLTYFQARQLLYGKYKGFVVGKYKVLEQLSTSGMSSVFLCEHILMHRLVAIKVLPVAKAQDPTLLARFYREARAIAQLDHPNIVRALDVETDGEIHFLVMEYVDGSSLQHIVRKNGPMPVVRASHYVRQAAIGLQHIHDMGLVHRDIKPGNLILDRQGTVKILDLGLAMIFNSEHPSRGSLTQECDKDTIMGTADYLSPEQAMNLHQVDIRSDIYSLGATLHCLIAGEPPLKGATVTQTLLFHQIKEPAPLSSIRPGVPEELSALVQRMMKKNPAERPQTPGEIAEALSAFTHPTIAPPPEDEMPRLCLAARSRLPVDEMALLARSRSFFNGGSSSNALSGARSPVKRTPEAEVDTKVNRLGKTQPIPPAPPAAAAPEQPAHPQPVPTPAMPPVEQASVSFRARHLVVLIAACSFLAAMLGGAIVWIMMMLTQG